MTVSNFSSYKGDAVTGSLTHRVNCVCVSDNTVCHTIALCYLRRKLFGKGRVSARGLGTSVPSVSVSFGLSPAANLPRACLGNQVIRGRVHAVTISSGIDPITTLKFIERTVMHLRRSVKHRGNVIVSKHSVNAAMFPSTRLGIFIATSTRVHTHHHCSRLRTGKRSNDLRRVLRGIGRHSHVSVAHRIDPLHGTSSTVRLSGDLLAPTRRGR